eukprot:c20504_g2_i1.p1 GENE.c20504_g2_i1~~c20504_g2_i1.p1  ORF type:complete len:710 (-),score=340.99 c20504_g2_i1:50-2179(-)
MFRFSQSQHIGLPIFIGQSRFFSAPSHNGKLVNKVLIANRGEIACRVITTCKKLNIQSVAVYSDEDRNAKHVRLADQAHHIGPAPALESYLCGEKLIEVAKKSGAQAIHPGYGFLSENSNFAELCAKNGVTFIGPPVNAIKSMGSKSESKALMEAANVPVVPGYHGDNQDDQFLLEQSVKIGFPVIIKPVLGGGGKGMRIVTQKSDFLAALESSRSEAIHSFKDDRVLVERYLVRPRHIEIQVFCDTHGGGVHLFERDCSVQRRHQKIYEEAPAPFLTEEVRAEIYAKAVAAAKAVGYVGAGTVEFIMDASTNEFFFMEMNTRLQVEHPVSEAITGVDLVEWQIRVASGQPIPCTQSEIKKTGHAIEARIYAEDPNRNFIPTAGHVAHLRIPKPDATFTKLGESGIRIDSGIEEGDKISSHYDPMIAKLIVKAPDREQALSKMAQSLKQFELIGVANNIEFLRRVCEHPAFHVGGVETGFIAQHEKDLMPKQKLGQHSDAVVLAVLGLFAAETNFTVPYRVNSAYHRQVEFKSADGISDEHLKLSCEYHSNTDITINGLKVKFITKPEIDSTHKNMIKVHIVAETNSNRVKGTVIIEKNQGFVHVFTNSPEHGDSIHTRLQVPTPKFREALSHVSDKHLVAPMPAEVRKVLVKAGDHVKKGDRLMVLVAMKMEHVISSPYNGKVSEVLFEEKQSVPAGAQLVVVVEEKK